MKKCINISFIYAIVALCVGVFYREYTKALDFTGRTTLAFAHGHLFALGVMLFFILAVFCKVTALEEQPYYQKFLIVYNVGLPFTVIMLIVRGVIQVLGIQLSRVVDLTVSGVAGVSHIVLTVGIVYLFLALRKIAET